MQHEQMRYCLQRAQSLQYPENIDCLDGVLGLASAIDKSDTLHCFHGHLGEEVRLRTDNLRRHRSLCRVEQSLGAQLLDGDSKGRLDVLACLAAGHSKTGNNSRRVDLVQSQLVCALITNNNFRPLPQYARYAQ